MVHPRVRTCSESKDGGVNPPKHPVKQGEYNEKAVYAEACHILETLQSGNKAECRLLLDHGGPVVVESGLDGGEVKQDSSCLPPEEKANPWEAVHVTDDSPSWSELSLAGKLWRVFIEWLFKALGLLLLLYMFVCSLDFLSSAFRLVGGKTAGQAFSSNSLMQNPVCGLMIGILATVLVQSSSTSTSIIITMVASDFLLVENAIFIIMGANIGTSVTNTIVSMAQSGDRDQFRRAFAGATLHDMFNWLSVAVLLPLEVVTGYLYHLTGWMTKSIGTASNSCAHSSCNNDFLKKLTKPLTEMVIKLDKNVIEGIALGKEDYMNKTMIKKYCSYDEVTVQEMINMTNSANATMNGTEGLAYWVEARNVTQKVGADECWFLLKDTGLSDTFVGLLLMAVSLLMLCVCLVLIVKLLNTVLKGQIATLVKKLVNAEFPGKCSYFTGYVAMLLGAGMTILVQSSSVFTSAMTPLVGVGVIRLERMYPLTLGSNIGTTATGLLAAMAASGTKLQHSIQIALVHLFFNISGILLFYPLPQLRFPIAMAKTMGNTTAKYRWFAILYLMVMFFLLPAFVFGLTMAGTVPFAVVMGVVAAIGVAVIILNIMQKKCKSRLPERLQTWDFLPCKWMHSLEPLDKLFTKLISIGQRLCCAFCKKRNVPKDKNHGEVVEERVCLESSTPSGGSGSLFTDAGSENNNLKDVCVEIIPKSEDHSSELDQMTQVNNEMDDSGFASRECSV